MPRSHEGLVSLIASYGLPEEVVEAFRAVDRAGFVPEGSVRDAYRDAPVPIPEGQTTSQPTLIAQMVAAAEISPGDRVLEVGTGYGYQTAVLSRLAGEVVSLERWSTLAEAARANLERNGVPNVSVYVCDGYEGWPGRAPYAAIVVSAAAPEVPAALAEQLAEGGRMVIPVESRYGDDVVVLLKTDGEVRRERLLTPARFVPLVRGKEERP
jgi:protein-L-isoaspartate(D-aspartate) O-methyltransferase